MIKKIVLKNIRTDGSTQQRPIDEDILKKYMTLMKEGFEFPPVSVFFDGKAYWLWDGFHRYHARRKLGKSSIDASVEDGTQRDAVWFSFQANKDHGFPRQPGTVKEILLELIFPDKEWGGQTDDAIAQWVGVTHSYISRIRKQQSVKSVHSTHSGQSQLRSAYQAKNADSGPEKSSGKQDSKPPETRKQGGNDDKFNDSKDLEGEKPKILDSVGETVPEHLVSVFSRVNEIKLLIRDLNQMLHRVREGQANNDPLYAYVKLNPLEVEMGNVKRNLKFGIPYAVCRYCGGDGKGCRACDELGFVNEPRYRTTAKELKK